MLEYTAAYYKDEESGRYTAEVLDFPGAISQGRTLKQARSMVRDALRELANYLVEQGEPLPQPNPEAAHEDAEFSEKIRLVIRVEAAVA
jgi:predicted RNase H-like HicB family nuclease